MAITLADRQYWMRQTIASATLEGATFNHAHLSLCQRVVAGDISAEDFVEAVLSVEHRTPHNDSPGRR